MNKLLAQATGQTIRQLNTLESRPRHLSDEEAVGLGFYGGIIR